MCLFNPWAVRSNEALNSFDSPLMKLLARAIYAICGRQRREGDCPHHPLDRQPARTPALSAFIKTKPVDLTMNTSTGARRSVGRITKAANR